jgi:riboflavin kinase/FMN adenylyltransferase
MQRWRGYTSVPGGWGRSVVTIGVFDGVHRGHQSTIAYAVRRATELGVHSVVVSFDPHPAEVVRPGSHPVVLTEPARKAELIAALGADALCVIPFTPQFSKLSAEEFVHDVLVARLHAALVVVGENFRFGHKAAGDVALLRRLGAAFGFDVESAPLVTGAGAEAAGGSGGAALEGHTVVSSTYTRACVDAGDVAAAARALGRPHRLEGVVVRGDQRGTKLGFPTANLLTSRWAAIPGDGVYAAWLLCRGRRYRSAVSVGTNPTFEGQERRVEAFALDFDGDLYGERIALDFVAFLREMRRYDTVQELVDQIDLDVERARAALVG